MILRFTLFRFESFTIELPDHVMTAPAMQYPFFIIFIPIHRELKKFRAVGHDAALQLTLIMPGFLVTRHSTIILLLSIHLPIDKDVSYR